MSSFNRELFCLEKQVKDKVDTVMCVVDDIVDNVVDDTYTTAQALEDRKYVQLHLKILLDDIVNFVNNNQEMMEDTPVEQSIDEQTIKTDSTGMPIISW